MIHTYATFEELHHCLTSGFGLLAEPAHGGSWRTYFHGRIVRHPSCSTRVAKVLTDQHGRPFSVQLCVSSDNNNHVCLPAPFRHDVLERALTHEIHQLTKNR